MRPTPLLLPLLPAGLLWPAVQIVKSKVKAEDGRGRFKTTSDKPLRIADREKKPALKT